MLSGTNCCFETQDEIKAIHQHLVRHFLSQRHIKSLHQFAHKQNTTTIKPPVSCTDKRQKVVSPHAGRLWNCWHWLPARDREVPLTNSLQPPQQRNQLTSIPSHRVFLSGPSGTAWKVPPQPRLQTQLCSALSRSVSLLLSP